MPLQTIVSLRVLPEDNFEQWSIDAELNLWLGS